MTDRAGSDKIWRVDLCVRTGHPPLGRFNFGHPTEDDIQIEPQLKRYISGFDCEVLKVKFPRRSSTLVALALNPGETINIANT